MHHLFPDIDDWIKKDIPVAQATVVSTWHSSPRSVGAKMFVGEDGKISGSVSGGCVEASVVEIAGEVLATDQPKLITYGVSNETAMNVGLSCGGEIEIFINLLNISNYNLIKDSWEQSVPAFSFTVLQGPPNLIGKEVIINENELSKNYNLAHSHSNKINTILTKTLENAAPVKKTFFAQDIVTIYNIDKFDSTAVLDVFIDVFLPPATLIIVGGVHIAIPLVHMANLLGLVTIIVDPRKKFGNRERFPHANRIINAWPRIALEGKTPLTSTTAVVVLTHDPKIDDPALEIALSSSSFYIGALGSRKTQRERYNRLIESGVTKKNIEKLSGPIGLDIGAKSPEEIALAIMAEIVKAKNAQ